MHDGESGHAGEAAPVASDTLAPHAQGAAGREWLERQRTNDALGAL